MVVPSIDATGPSQKRMTKISSTAAGSSGRSQGARIKWELEWAKFQGRIRKIDAIIKEKDAIAKEKDATIKEKDAIIKEKDAMIKYQKGQITELTIQLDTFRKAIENNSQPTAQNDAVTALHEISGSESDNEVEILAVIRPEDRVYEIVDLSETIAIEPEKENDVDTNLLGLDGETALHRAVMQGDVAAVRDLIRRGEDVNAENRRGLIPLQLAHLAQYKSNSQSCIDIIKMLIEGGADAYKQGEMLGFGRTFLHSLCYEKISPGQFAGLAEYLVSKGFCDLFNKPDFIDSTPFHCAVEYVEVERATRKLLKKNGVNINAIHVWGDGALKFAICWNRTVKAMSNLIELGVDFKLKNKKGENLLHVAAARGRATHLKFLLTKKGKGLDVNGRDVDGNTPLHKIGSGDPCEGHAVCVRLLLQNGADKTLRNNERLFPFELAGKNHGANKEDILQLLRIIN